MSDLEGLDDESSRKRKAASSSSLEPPSKKQSVLTFCDAQVSPQLQQETKLLAEKFVESIMKPCEVLPCTYCQDDKKCEGMSVFRDVVDLESGYLKDVVIREITQPFWQACYN